MRRWKDGEGRLERERKRDVTVREKEGNDR